MNDMGAMNDMGGMGAMSAASLPLDWLLLVCAIAIFGTCAFALAIAPQSDSHSAEAARRIIRLARWLAALSAALTPFALIDTVAEMAAVPFGAAIALVPQVLHQTHVGRIWVWKTGATLLLMIVAWLPGSPRRRLVGLSVMAAAILLLRALSSHAIDKGALAVASYFIHELAAALWFGALAGLCAGFAPQPLGVQWFSHAVPRVSRLAGWCVAVVVVAGCFNAYEALGWNMDHLLHAAYGRTLIAKVMTAAVIVAIGGYNRLWLVPRADESEALRDLVRNVAVESVLLLAVLGWSVRLANTPPAH